MAKREYDARTLRHVRAVLHRELPAIRELLDWFDEKSGRHIDARHAIERILEAVDVPTKQKRKRAEGAGK